MPCSPTMMSNVFEVGLDRMQCDAVRICLELIRVPPQKGRLLLLFTNPTCHGREYGETGVPPTICPVTKSLVPGATPHTNKST